jgi:phage protein D
MTSPAMLRPTFTITSGAFRSNTANPVGSVRRIVIRRDMDTPADALEITFAAKPSITLGTDVVVKLGYKGSAEETVYTGVAATLTPMIDGYMVRALGKMQALLNLRKGMLFEKKTVGAIVRSLLGDAKLTAGKVTAGPSLPAYAIDSRVNAYTHLAELAERLGFEFYTDVMGKVNFHDPAPTAATMTFTYGVNILEADFAQHPAAFKKVTVGAESPVSKKGEKTAHWLTTNDKDYRGTAGSSTPDLLVIDPVARTKEAAATFAKGRLAVAQRRAKLIMITVPGAPKVDLGEAVKVDKVPNIAASTGYVCAVHHCLDAETGFTTRITLSVK